MEVVEQVNVDQGVYARLRSLIVERIDAEAALHMKPEELEEQVARTNHRQRGADGAALSERP